MQRQLARAVELASRGESAAVGRFLVRDRVSVVTTWRKKSPGTSLSEFRFEREEVAVRSDMSGGWPLELHLVHQIEGGQSGAMGSLSGNLSAPIVRRRRNPRTW